MAIKPKKKGRGMWMRSFEGEDGNTYLVFCTTKGSYHVFMEVEAKEADRQCGAKKEGTTHSGSDSI